MKGRLPKAMLQFIPFADKLAKELGKQVTNDPYAALQKGHKFVQETKESIEDHRRAKDLAKDALKHLP